MSIEVRKQKYRNNKVRAGYMMALFCALLWGLWYIPGDSKVIWSLEPFTTMYNDISIVHGGSVALIIVAMLITALGSLSIVLLLFLWNGYMGKYKLKELKRCLKQTRSCTKYYFFGAIFGEFVAILGSFIAMGFVGAGFAAVAGLLYVVVGTPLGAKFLGEKVTKRALLGIIIILIGGVSIYAGSMLSDLSNPLTDQPWIGIIGGIMAAVGWGIEGVVATKGLEVSEPDIAIHGRFITAALMWWVIVLPVMQLLGFDMFGYVLQMDIVAWLVVITMGLTFGICYVTWYRSFPLIGVARGQGLASLYGLIAVVALFLLLGYGQSWTLLLGCVVTITGSLIMCSENSADIESLRRDVGDKDV